MGNGTTITINDEIDFLGILSDIYANTYESYQKFNDEPVIKVEEKNKWLVAGLTAVVAVAVVGAIAATPLCVGGQMAVNGVLGGVQSALTGGGKEDILEGIAIGVICGGMGGAGFVNGWPKSGYINRELVWSLFHPFKTLTREGIKAIRTGVIRSSTFNFAYSLGKKFVSDRLEDLYEAITE